MKLTTICVLFALLTSCTSMDIDGVRLTLTRSELTATEEVGEGLSDSADGNLTAGRVELTNQLGNGLEVGTILGVGSGDLPGLDFYTYDVGTTIRQYITTEGNVRPFGEFSTGYRRMQFGEGIDGTGGLDLIFGQASAGLEFLLAPGVSVFASAGYEGTYGDDFHTDGPILSVGGAVSF